MHITAMHAMRNTLVNLATTSVFASIGRFFCLSVACGLWLSFFPVVVPIACSRLMLNADSSTWRIRSSLVHALLFLLVVFTLKVHVSILRSLYR